MRNVLIVALLLVILLVMGGLPIGLISALFFGSQVGQAMFWLAGLLVATFFPSKLLVDRLVKGEGSIQLPLGQLPPLVLLFSGFVFVILVPILWSATAPALLAGALVYAFTAQSLAAALFGAFGVQVLLLARTARLEKERGEASTIFSQFQQMQKNFNVQTIVITPDGVYDSSGVRSAAREDEYPHYLDDNVITIETVDDDDEGAAASSSNRVPQLPPTSAPDSESDSHSGSKSS